MTKLTIGILLAVYALILWILVLWVLRKGHREWKANRANRLREFRARVVDKRAAPVSGGGIGAQNSEYSVTFEYAGRQADFKVDPTVHSAVRIGQEGTLRLRGEQFEEFIAKSEGEQADDIYRRMVKD